MELLPVREFADRGTKWLLESPENVSGLLRILDVNLVEKIISLVYMMRRKLSYSITFANKNLI